MNMKRLPELLETGKYESRVVKKGEILTLNMKYCGVLVNGKKVITPYYLNKDDKVVILPHLKGGDIGWMTIGYDKEESENEEFKGEMSWMTGSGVIKKKAKKKKGEF